MWRRLTQIFSAIIINPYLPSIFHRTIYQGRLKNFCIPALNCYSCPLAIFACPIGSIQYIFANIRSSLAAGSYHLNLYVIGILGVVGSAVGRMACGWICPFGFLQDAIYKVPSRKFEIPRLFTYFKYLVLAVMVVALPLIVIDSYGFGHVWFCKYLCPAGTLEAGIPMISLDPSLRTAIGAQFWLKISILAFFLIIMVPTRRPFCRTTCPLGAIFSFFNRVSILRLKVSSDCITCNRCYKICPMSIKIYEDPDNKDCIRCLDCVKVCPVNAISYHVAGRKIGSTEPF
jgi:polyferredoxin